jgi:hypothetical protein
MVGARVGDKATPLGLHERCFDSINQRLVLEKRASRTYARTRGLWFLGLLAFGLLCVSPIVYWFDKQRVLPLDDTSDVLSRDAI